MKWLKSKTLWAIVLLAITNGVPAVAEQIPGTAGQIVDVLLTLLGIYGRVNPQVK
jgi:hypothetical protein